MRELIEFRISNKYANLLLQSNEGIKNGLNTIIRISKSNPKFEQIKILYEQIKRDYNDFLFIYSNIKREYTEKELNSANLFQIKIKKTFEPAGEESGTKYDEKEACKICGANRRKIGPLILKNNSIPKTDIARTIAGEIVVSEKFVNAFSLRKLTGVTFTPVYYTTEGSNYYELNDLCELQVSDNTLAGVNIFDLSEYEQATVLTLPGGQKIHAAKEVYKCPLGHTIGLNLLSELFVLKSSLINNHDLYLTKQKVGVKRGLLRPESLYICSGAFRKMINEEGLTGFEFEIVNID